MKTLLSKSIKTAILFTSLGATGLAFAGHNTEDFVRQDPDAPSNSGHDVTTFCGGRWDGTDYVGQIPASATLFTRQKNDGTTKARIKIKNGRPNTLYTVWLRVKGDDQDGNAFGGSPLTGGGATPMASGSELDQLAADWIGAGNANPANGFTTNGNGKGNINVTLDFPLDGGAYPFNQISAAALDDIRINKNAAALATPTAIVDPGNDGVSGPFLLRIVSHCQDGLGHGLSPANRESWFDFPE